MGDLRWFVEEDEEEEEEDGGDADWVGFGWVAVGVGEGGGLGFDCCDDLGGKSVRLDARWMRISYHHADCHADATDDEEELAAIACGLLVDVIRRIMKARLTIDSPNGIQCKEYSECSVESIDERDCRAR